MRKIQSYRRRNVPSRNTLSRTVLKQNGITNKIPKIDNNIFKEIVFTRTYYIIFPFISSSRLNSYNVSTFRSPCHVANVTFNNVIKRSCTRAMDEPCVIKNKLFSKNENTIRMGESGDDHRFVNEHACTPCMVRVGFCTLTSIRKGLKRFFLEHSHFLGWVFTFLAAIIINQDTRFPLNRLMSLSTVYK